MLTVINWFAARRSRRALSELVARELTSAPTLLAIVSDKYTQETSIRPFAPLAERFGDRLHVLLLAEWDQPDRERDGESLLRSLGLAVEVRPRMLRDEGPVRTALVLRQKQPIALIDLFFVERGKPLTPRPDDERELELRSLEDAAARELERLLVRIPAQPPAPPPPLAPGQHDFNPQGLCRLCTDGRSSLRPCPGTRRDEDPKRDRFELIELE